MPRGQRRSALEKLHFELTETKDTITQYESCLKTLKQKEEDLEKQVKMEELKEVTVILDESGITMDELKNMLQEKILENMSNQKQSA